MVWNESWIFWFFHFHFLRFQPRTKKNPKIHCKFWKIDDAHCSDFFCFSIKTPSQKEKHSVISLFHISWNYSWSLSYYRWSIDELFYCDHIKKIIARVVIFKTKNFKLILLSEYVNKNWLASVFWCTNMIVTQYPSKNPLIRVEWHFFVGRVGQVLRWFVRHFTEQ